MKFGRLDVMSLLKEWLILRICVQQWQFRLIQCPILGIMVYTIHAIIKFVKSIVQSPVKHSPTVSLKRRKNYVLASPGAHWIKRSYYFRNVIYIIAMFCVVQACACPPGVPFLYLLSGGHRVPGMGFYLSVPPTELLSPFRQKHCSHNVCTRWWLMRFL